MSERLRQGRAGICLSMHGSRAEIPLLTSIKPFVNAHERIRSTLYSFIFHYQCDDQCMAKKWWDDGIRTRRACWGATGESTPSCVSGDWALEILISSVRSLNHITVILLFVY